MAVAKEPPSKRSRDEQVEIDFLVCRQCNTPCYIFEADRGSVQEAQCLVCGNDEPALFAIGDDPGSETDR